MGTSLLLGACRSNSKTTSSGRVQVDDGRGLSRKVEEKTNVMKEQHHVPCVNINVELRRCYTELQPQTIWKICWRLIRQQGEADIRSRYSRVLLSYCCNYTKSLVILSEGMQSWLKINFRDIKKKANLKNCTVPTGPRACAREKGGMGFFFPSAFWFSLCWGESASSTRELAVSQSQIMILFRAASDVEPGSIQLALGCNLMQCAGTHLTKSNSMS